jgi:hypothetical protein
MRGWGRSTGPPIRILAASRLCASLNPPRVTRVRRVSRAEGLARSRRAAKHEGLGPEHWPTHPDLGGFAALRALELAPCRSQASVLSTWGCARSCEATWAISIVSVASRVSRDAIAIASIASPGSRHAISIASVASRGSWDAISIASVASPGSWDAISIVSVASRGAWRGIAEAGLGTRGSGRAWPAARRAGRVANPPRSAWSNLPARAPARRKTQ